MNEFEFFPRRARVIAEGSGHFGDVREAVGRDDPRVKAHPQPGHQEWEVFLFGENCSPWGLGFMENEIEWVSDGRS